MFQNIIRPVSMVTGGCSKVKRPGQTRRAAALETVWCGSPCTKDALATDPRLATDPKPKSYTLTTAVGAPA